MVVILGGGGEIAETALDTMGEKKKLDARHRKGLFGKETLRGLRLITLGRGDPRI